MRNARRGMLFFLGLLGAGALSSACRRESAPVVVIDARNQASPTPSPPAAAADLAATPAAGTAAAAAAPASADSAEEDAAVEISGEINLPPGPATKDRLFVYVAQGDCLNDAAPLLRRLPVSDNRTYFAAVIAPRGSSLSVCAAAEPAAGKPPHLYGRAREALTLAKTADQSFRDVDVTLAEGAPRRFPTQVAR